LLNDTGINGSNRGYISVSPTGGLGSGVAKVQGSSSGPLRCLSDLNPIAKLTQ